MRIICRGAARTVTGSCYQVEMDDDSNFLVDCGLFQGGRQIERRNWHPLPFEPRLLSGIFITHAHIDHSGLVPRMVRLGYEGPIFATEATCDLLRILWLDAAHIQEMESEWQSRKNKRKGNQAVEPLYETKDAETAAGQLVPIQMNGERELIPGVHAQFVAAGHILGAASLYLTLDSQRGPYRVGFSGDLGRPGQLIVPDSDAMPKPDSLFMETTYGNRFHKTYEESRAELLEIINQAYKEGGRVIIPAFAVERTQELIYILADAYRKDQIPKNMPIFLDSPLAIKATEIFRDHPDFFDEQTRATLARGETPLNFPNLRFTPSTEESRKINEYQGTAVIMAGSGMANAGRIKHHLKHNLWRPDSHVVIVGFQAQGTTGRLLVDGAKKVKIFREDVAVKAKVHTIGGFSAHADQGDLLEWLSHLVHPNLKVYLMHGEETSALDFAKVARERFPGIKFHVPRWKEIITLTPRKRKAVAAKPAAAPVPEPKPAPEPMPGPTPAPAPTQVAEGEDVLGAPAAPDEVIGLVQRADLLRHQLREITRELQRHTKPLAPGRAEAWEKALAELEGLIDQEEAGPGGQPRR